MITRIPLHRLVIGPDHPAGCSLQHVSSLLSGSSSDERPLEVALTLGGFYEILNGRHRYLRAVIAGWPDIECVVSA